MRLRWDQGQNRAFLVLFFMRAAGVNRKAYFIRYMMSGSKAPDFDAYGLLRATHSHNPTRYEHKNNVTVQSQAKFHKTGVKCLHF